MKALKGYRFITVSLFSCLLQSCVSSASIDSTSNIFATPAEISSPIERDWKSIYFEGINERLTGTGIPTSSDQILPSEYSEIRIWSGFSTLPLKGLILERKRDKSSAKYLRPRPDDSSSACLRYLADPKSGWATFWRVLESHDVASMEDSNDIAKIDEGSLVVEVHMSDDYRTYKYSGVSKEKAGNHAKLFEILELIKEEFGVDLLWAPAPNGPEICRE